MTWYNSFYITLEDFNCCNATLIDGDIACVQGKGPICSLDALSLNEIQYIEGLKSNLININQIWDKFFGVMFT